MSPTAPPVPILRRLRRSLSARLAALYLVLLLVATVAGLWLTWTFSSRYVREVEQRVDRPVAQALARELAALGADGPDAPAALAAERRVQALHPALDLYLLDADGRVVRAFGHTSRPARPRVDLGPVRAFLGGGRLPILGDDPGEASGREVFSAAAVTYGAGQEGYLYAILRGMPRMVVADAVRESYVARTFAWSLAVVLGLASVSGLVLFGRLTRRFRRLSATVERFRGGDLSARAPEASDDEIGMLGHTFNAMAGQIAAHLDALEAADDARRALAENVAHDLRTALARARASAEHLLAAGDALAHDERQAALHAILAATTRLAMLTDQLALLSDLDARRVAPRPEPFSAAELAHDVALRFRPDAERRGVALDAATDRRLMPVHADIALVERVLANLIENALHHTPPGGHIRVSADEAPGGVRVAVADTGAGIAADDLPHVTRRFYRTAASRAAGVPGTGLGLAIAHELVGLHGGALVVESAAGAGTTVSFTLPAAEPAGVPTTDRA